MATSALPDLLSTYTQDSVPLPRRSPIDETRSFTSCPANMPIFSLSVFYFSVMEIVKLGHLALS